MGGCDDDDDVDDEEEEGGLLHAISFVFAIVPVAVAVVTFLKHRLHVTSISLQVLWV
jgi:hypothetical protein